MKLLRLTAVAFLLALNLFGCFRKPAGFGEDTDLFVIADSTNWIELEPAIRAAFERVIRTPQPEKVFEVFWASPSKFRQFATRKNLVIAGILDSGGEMDTKIESMLSAQVKAKVREGEAFYFPKEAPWAENQLLLVLTSNSIAQLRQKISENRGTLYDLFRDHLIANTKEQMYRQMEQTELSQEFLDKYGWTIRVQHDYFINVDRQQDRFLMLRRSLPGRERWFFVHWIEDADANIIDKEWAINTRNKLTEKFYYGDYIDENHVEVSEEGFKGRDALVLQGLWANDERAVGGPFRNYSFYDPASRRVYMIDIAVFYPGGEKEPFLRQLDIMAHTFRTVFDKAEEIREEGS